MKTVIYILFFLTLISCTNENKLVSPVKFEGKYGFIDKSGDWHIKPTFDSLGIFYNGYADSYRNGKNGIIDSKGIIIIENKYDFVGHVENDIALILLNDQFNYVDLQGQLISNKYFSDAEDFSNGLAGVQYNDNGKWGYLNKKGELQIDTLYEYISDFKNNKAEVEIDDYTFLINNRGKILDTIIEMPRKERAFTLIGYSGNGTLGIVNQKGDTIMNPQYNSFGYVQNGKFWFNEKNKYGLADTIGTILIEPKYEYLSYFSDNGLATAKIKGKYGYINENGDVIIDFKFQDARGFKYDLASVKFNDKWGFIDRKGDFVIEPNTTELNISLDQ